jgi:tetratricopeptide (TPR) repeat protein
LDAAERLGRPVHEINELRRSLMSCSVGAEDAFYWRAAADWLKELERDSGLLFWRELGDGDPAGRLGRALEMAARNYASTPERDRGYPPDEAVKALCHYVVISIAIGSRSMNYELLETLPALLEPFAPMFPLVDAILQNTIATCESRSRGQPERGRLRWMEVHDRLGKMTGTELPYVQVLRNAVAFGIGSLEARMGLTSATAWAERLDTDGLQKVNALYLRKIVALQLGDSERAESYRKQAEIFALQARQRQMFTTTLPVELAAHALAGDLTGVKQIIARIQPLAEACPGWRGYAELAEAQFQQLRGDPEAARAAFERCLTMISDPAGRPRAIVVWPPAIAGYLETLVALGRYQDARTCGERALVTCKELEIGVMSHEISRGLAMAEGKLGDYPSAVARLEVVIAEQKRLGVTGLILGASYEARARIAIWAGDEAALTEYATLTAREYRHGGRSSLGARWERLMAEARRTSKRALPRLADFESSRLLTGFRASATEMASDVLKLASTRQERAERALKLLCDDRCATSGYLYLVSNAGLALAASQGGESAPPEGLLEHLNEYFEREVSESGDDTAALTGGDVESALAARPCFRDGAGVEHRLVLLTSLAASGARHAGVAALVERPRVERPAGGAELVSALSTHLIQSGDTRGVGT